jgi:hypothetical protein
VAALEAEYEDGRVVSRRRSVARGDKAKYEGFRNNQFSGDLHHETGMGRAEREKYEKEQADKTRLYCSTTTTPTIMGLQQQGAEQLSGPQSSWRKKIGTQMKTTCLNMNQMMTTTIT